MPQARGLPASCESLCFAKTRLKMEGQRAAVLSAKLYRSLTTHTFSKLSAECQSLSHKSRDLQPIARHHTVSTCLTCIAQLAGLRAIIHQLTEAETLVNHSSPVSESSAWEVSHLPQAIAFGREARGQQDGLQAWCC